MGWTDSDKRASLSSTDTVCTCQLDMSFAKLGKSYNLFTLYIIKQEGAELNQGLQLTLFL